VNSLRALCFFCCQRTRTQDPLAALRAKNAKKLAELAAKQDETASVCTAVGFRFLVGVVLLCCAVSLQLAVCCARMGVACSHPFCIVGPFTGVLVLPADASRCVLLVVSLCRNRFWAPAPSHPPAVLSLNSSALPSSLLCCRCIPSCLMLGVCAFAPCAALVLLVRCLGVACASMCCGV
jgi:hypothetical protein